jgi:hypothetical protein
MKTTTLLLLFVSYITISCSKDVENISIKGTVYNKHTQKPLTNKNIQIEIECWKYGRSTDESYGEHEKKHVRVDSDGNYIVNFNKGAFVTFAISTNGFGYYIDNLYINSNENTHDINLIPLH